jgi:hypothetical protein
MKDVVMSGFWSEFHDKERDILGIRAATMQLALEQLDKLGRPVLIVETGSARTHAIGDGQSTFLFEKYLKRGPGGKLVTCDLSQDATNFCAQHLDPNFSIAVNGDSVHFLNKLDQYLSPEFSTVDLLYLDSYDVDMLAPHESALHHLYELVAAKQWLRKDSLVLIDDSPKNYSMCANLSGQFQLMAEPRTWGKGLYVANYAKKVGAQVLIENYQVLFTGM